MINRVQKIKEKGFAMNLSQDDNTFTDAFGNVDFSKIKVGVKSLEDAVVTLGDYGQANPQLSDKKNILEAIANSDYERMREVSDFFFRVSGIYGRLCRYMAYLYRYDWMITPYIYSDTIKEEKVVEGFHQALAYLDNFKAKKTFQDIALKVLKYGCYYCYINEQNGKVSLQELPASYCRSRFEVNGRPAIEFNMKFFNDFFRDETQRKRMLKVFPEEFAKGYDLYIRNKLVGDYPGDRGGWYLLDPDNAFMFSLSGESYPVFISVIPAIIDLDEAKAVDKKKAMQQLLKIVIQKMPIDKNGDLVFDVDEATALHNNAVAMLSRAVGVDVLTSFADVSVADMSDRGMASSADGLEKVERGVFNEAGVSQMQFNTSGNLALEKSTLNDEASMMNLVLQFEDFLNRLLKPFNKNMKKYCYKVQILPTTIYNYKELSKIYKEQTQLGYSKMLPQIALGQTQSSILATAKFENEILELYKIFIPPMMSSTMNSDAIDKDGGDKKVKTDEEKKPGRKEKADDEKSEKTIQNRESMS